MKVHQAGLARRLRYWMRALKLEGWTIKIRFRTVPSGDDTVAELEHCSPVERAAAIFVAEDYAGRAGHGVSFNLDTLILHELIHVVLWDEWERLPTRTKGRADVKRLEEFVCFHFAKIIYDLKKGK